MEYGSKEWQEAVELLCKITARPKYICENALYITLGNLELSIGYLKNKENNKNPSRN